MQAEESGHAHSRGRGLGSRPTCLRQGRDSTSISEAEDSAEALESSSLHARARAATEAARSLRYGIGKSSGDHYTTLDLGHGILGWEAWAARASQLFFRVGLDPNIFVRGPACRVRTLGGSKFGTFGKAQEVL